MEADILINKIFVFAQLINHFGIYNNVLNAYFLIILINSQGSALLVQSGKHSLLINCHAIKYHAMDRKFLMM